MKDRFPFCCASVVALVLVLTAAPSKATERRDPILNPESTPQSSNPVHGTDGAVHTGKTAKHGKKLAAAGHGKSGDAAVAAKRATKKSSGEESGSK